MPRPDPSAASPLEGLRVLAELLDHIGRPISAETARNGADEIERLQRELATRLPNQEAMNRRAER